MTRVDALACCVCAAGCFCDSCEAKVFLCHGACTTSHMQRLCGICCCVCLRPCSLLASGGTVVQLADGSSLSCDVLVGADGANSKLAQQLGLPPPNYAGYVAYRSACCLREVIAELNCTTWRGCACFGSASAQRSPQAGVMCLWCVYTLCHGLSGLVCRGLAEYPAGSSLPLPSNTIRQMFGCGVRAGMYPITQQQLYWYICFNAAEVGVSSFYSQSRAEWVISHRRTSSVRTREGWFLCLAYSLHAALQASCHCSVACA